MSIQDFFVKKAKDIITSERGVEPCGSNDTESAMTVQDQIMKAETLWALKTASENFSFRVSEYLKIFREYQTLITLYTLIKPQMLKVRSKWIFL